MAEKTFAAKYHPWNIIQRVAGCTAQKWPRYISSLFSKQSIIYTNQISVIGAFGYLNGIPPQIICDALEFNKLAHIYDNPNKTLVLFYQLWDSSTDVKMSIGSYCLKNNYFCFLNGKRIPSDDLEKNAPILGIYDTDLAKLSETNQSSPAPIIVLDSEFSDEIGEVDELELSSFIKNNEEMFEAAAGGAESSPETTEETSVDHPSTPCKGAVKAGVDNTPNKTSLNEEEDDEDVFSTGNSTNNFN